MEDVLVTANPGQDLWRNVRVQASVDTRSMVDLVEEGGPPNTICELVQGFGVACEECNDGKVFCLPLVIEDAEAVPYSPGVERIGSDCPDCGDEECVPMSCTVGLGGQGSLAVLGLLGLLVLRRRKD